MYLDYDKLARWQDYMCQPIKVKARFLVNVHGSKWEVDFNGKIIEVPEEVFHQCFESYDKEDGEYVLCKKSIIDALSLLVTSFQHYDRSNVPIC